MVKNLRESAIKDVLDTIEDIGDSFDRVSKPGKSRGANPTLSVSSISRASKDLIMSFPVLCDNSLDPKTASMICKAIERKAVTMLQLLFASCSFNGNNGREILAQWHSNIADDRFTLDDYLDLCDRFSEACDSKDDRIAIREATEKIRNEMRTPEKRYPVSSFSEASINDYKVHTRNGRVLVTEAPVFGGKKSLDTEEREFNLQRARRSMDLADKEYELKVHNQNRQEEMDKWSQKRSDARDIEDAIQHKAQRGNWKAQQAYWATQGDKADTDFLRQQLLDNDVKKANELVPTLMIVKFNSPDSAGGAMVTNQFVAGVKARLIPVDSYEIIDRVASKNKDRAGLVNLVRATTKEISFVKDYLLAIDRAKLDAKNNSIRNKSSRIWKTLEKRSTKSVWKRLRNKTNDAACITTLVMSQQIVNILKKEYNVNMADMKTANTIMDAYNLLALVIVDESMEVARFLYDGDNSYEDLSFNSLERESGDGSYKKVINLLSKMNR